MTVIVIYFTAIYRINIMTYVQVGNATVMVIYFTAIYIINILTYAQVRSSITVNTLRLFIFQFVLAQSHDYLFVPIAMFVFMTGWGKYLLPYVFTNSVTHDLRSHGPFVLPLLNRN